MSTAMFCRSRLCNIGRLHARLARASVSPAWLHDALRSAVAFKLRVGWALNDDHDVRKLWAYLEEERSRHVVDSQDRRPLCLANVELAKGQAGCWLVRRQPNGSFLNLDVCETF